MTPIEDYRAGYKAALSDMAEAVDVLRGKPGTLGVQPGDVARATRAVSHVFGVEEEKITGSNRTKNVSLARHTAMHIAKDYTGRSLTEVGRFFQRDHTSVIHGLERVRKLLNTDPIFSAKYGKAANLYRLQTVSKEANDFS